MYISGPVIIQLYGAIGMCMFFFAVLLKESIHQCC